MALKELYEEMRRLAEELQAFVAEHEDEDGNFTEEDAATYDKMHKKICLLRKKITRQEDIERANSFLNEPVAPAVQPILNYPGAGMFGNGKVGRASDEYRKAALDAVRSKFSKVSNALQTNPDLSGGYLIPDEWDTRLIQTLEEENVMRNLGTSFPTSGDHKINIAATKPAALWVAEGGAMTFGNGTFSQISLDAHKVHVGILVTEELLNDNAFNLENYILNEFGKAIANAEEDAFINGDGSGKPTGFLTTLAADATTYITTTGASISADDVINLEYSLKRPYRRNAAWLVNDATLAQIRKFKDSTQNYIWQPSYVAGEPDRLLGYPIYTTPYMPKAESGNFALAFGDFSFYNIADRGSRAFQRLDELYAANGMTGFLLKERVDGILVDNSAIRALKIK